MARLFGLQLVLIWGVVAACSYAQAAPIYVYTEPDGVVRFSSKPPPSGTKAKVFTAKSSKFSWYKTSKTRRSGLYLSEYSGLVDRYARAHNISPALVRAVIHAESSFNPQAVSPKGARGLMQLMPSVGRDQGVQNFFSPAENIRAGVSHLASLLRVFNGNVTLALAAYNAGAEAVRRHSGVPPYRETQHYVKRVINLEKRYRARL